MPECECYDWRWTLLPCKHILAVILHCQVPWDSLPQQYTSSPYFNLDLDVIALPVAVDPTLSCNDDEDHEILESPITDDQLPSTKKGPKSQKKALAILCREKLSIIQNATYLCQDEDALRHLSTLLGEASEYIAGHLHKDEGLVPEPESQKSKKSLKRPRTETTEDAIPVKQIKTGSSRRLKLSKKKKQPKRYGRRAEQCPITIKDEELETPQEDIIIVEGHEDLPNSLITKVQGTKATDTYNSCPV